MILQKLAGAIRRQDWFVVLLELLVVVIGIFIGLQVDDWNKARQDRALESEYLTRLIVDLEEDQATIDRNSEWSRERIASIEQVLRIVAEPELAAANPGAFVRSVEEAGWPAYRRPIPRTWTELQSAGRTLLIRSPELRNRIDTYYLSWDSLNRLIEDDQVHQQLYELETAGILGADTLAQIQLRRASTPIDLGAGRTVPEPVGPEREIVVSKADAVRVARTLAGMPDALRLLPNAHNHQVLVLRLNESSRQRVQDLIADLRRYRATL